MENTKLLTLSFRVQRFNFRVQRFWDLLVIDDSSWPIQAMDLILSNVIRNKLYCTPRNLIPMLNQVNFHLKPFKKN